MKQIISLAQMNIQLGAPQANLTLVEPWIREAAGLGSQMLLLPELWTTGYALDNAHALAQENAAMLPRLEKLARDHSLSIGGSMLLEQDGLVYNTFMLFMPTGEAPISYSKIHLFRLMDEDKWLSPGKALQQASLPWGSAGLAICYDLRFPEMFRTYAVAGAQLFLISAEWPAKRVMHWQTLLRARAIENQCFVAATNCCGVTGGETFGGCSALISPWGETIIAGSTDQPALLTAKIDLAQVDAVRQQIPILRDRRPDLY